jgi:hypothetical protein
VAQLPAFSVPRLIIEVVTIRHLLLPLAGLLLAGCGNRAAQNEAAVRQGVMDYLAQRSNLNLNAMQVDVTAVSFRQDEADAVVAFRPKGAVGGGMQMRYTLERKGDRWVVKGHGQSQAGQAPHGQMPSGAQGMGGMPAPAGQSQGGTGLPPGHPPVGKPSGAK